MRGRNNLLNVIVLLLSILLIVFGLLVNPNFKVEYTTITGADLKYILPSVGSSLLASLLFSILTVNRINQKESSIKLFTQLGLVNFYLERSEITERCALLFKNAQLIDITAIRLKTLLETHENTLNNLLRTKPVRIRILMPNPDSESAKTIEELLGTKESIRAGLRNVLEWEKRIKGETLTGTLEIRYSDKLIASMYQRIDNYVFTGPYMNKTESQGTYTLECNAFGQFGGILSNDFESRFKPSDSFFKRKIIRY